MTTIIKWAVIGLIGFAMGAITCYLVTPKAEVGPYIMLPETKIPAFKD